MPAAPWDGVARVAVVEDSEVLEAAAAVDEVDVFEPVLVVVEFAALAGALVIELQQLLDEDHGLVPSWLYSFNATAS